MTEGKNSVSFLYPISHQIPAKQVFGTSSSLELALLSFLLLPLLLTRDTFLHSFVKGAAGSALLAMEYEFGNGNFCARKG